VKVVDDPAAGFELQDANELVVAEREHARVTVDWLAPSATCWLLPPLAR
jgi:hypothetical protein